MRDSQHLNQVGKKAFHGVAYEFVRNDAMDANNYFANLAGQPKPNLKYNNFGYNVGGPIYLPSCLREKIQNSFSSSIRNGANCGKGNVYDRRSRRPGAPETSVASALP